jgi:hypothetical protein
MSLAVAETTPQEKPAGPVRRWWRWFIVGAFVLMCLVVGDWYMRNLEMDHLIAAIQHAETAELRGADRVDGRGDEQFAASISRDSFGSHLPTDVPYSYERRQCGKLDLQECTYAVQVDAAREVYAAQVGVSDVSVLPWHHRIDLAKRRYLTHAELWRSYFEDRARDRDTTSESVRIGPTFNLAMGSLRKAVPFVPLYHLRARVHAIAKAGGA